MFIPRCPERTSDTPPDLESLEYDARCFGHVWSLTETSSTSHRRVSQESGVWK